MPSLSLKSLTTHWVRCSGNLCIATHSVSCTRDKRHDPFLRYLNTLHVPNSFIYTKQTTGVSCVRAMTLHAYCVTVTVNPMTATNYIKTYFHSQFLPHQGQYTLAYNWKIAFNKMKWRFTNAKRWLNAHSACGLKQCLSTCVSPRPCKFLCHKKRARSQQIYS
jgi:hypothetical protein